MASALCNLALAYSEQGRRSEARTAIARAYAVGEKVLPEDHPGLALVLATYARLMRGTKEGANARKLNARAKEILNGYNRRNRTWSIDVGDSAYLPRGNR